MQTEMEGVPHIGVDSDGSLSLSVTGVTRIDAYIPEMQDGVRGRPCPSHN